MKSSNQTGRSTWGKCVYCHNKVDFDFQGVPYHFCNKHQAILKRDWTE